MLCITVCVLCSSFLCCGFFCATPDVYSALCLVLHCTTQLDVSNPLSHACSLICCCISMLRVLDAESYILLAFLMQALKPLQCCTRNAAVHLLSACCVCAWCTQVLHAKHLTTRYSVIIPEHFGSAKDRVKNSATVQQVSVSCEVALVKRPTMMFLKSVLGPADACCIHC